MRPRQILYIHRTQAIGAEGTHIRGMVDGFLELGCNVEIFGPPGVCPYAHVNTRKEVSKAPSNFSKLLRFFAEYAPQPIFEGIELLYNLPAQQRLKSKQHKKCSFIYERYALNSLHGSWLAKNTGWPLILEVNDATVIERSRPLSFKKIAKKNEETIFRQAELLITISNYFKNLIVEEYQISPDKVLVLPNAIDPKRFDLNSTNHLIREDLGIPENAIVLGCLGAFLPWHGLDFLVDTMADEVIKHNLFFLFIGDGPVRDSVEASASQMGVGDKVLMTGFLPPDEAIKYLDLVDICVLPDSNSHCSPMKLFEFMGMGKPVVLPAYNPLLETLQDGKQGIFFEPKDSEGLRTSLLSLISSQNMRQRIGLSAKKLVLEKHIWSQHAKKVLSYISKNEVVKNES